MSHVCHLCLLCATTDTVVWLIHGTTLKLGIQACFSGNHVTPLQGDIQCLDSCLALDTDISAQTGIK